MHITRLALDHFRSWTQCVVDFEPGITVLCGSNGLGKTNLVESIEVLGTGASHRTSSLLPLIQQGESSASIHANVSDVASETASDATITTYDVTLNARGANRARINGGASRYMRDVIGMVPCITFVPDDQRLVAGDPAARRTLLNQSGVLLYAEYADVLQRCTHIAKQRAALLKQLNQRADDTPAALNGLEIWTGQFIEAGMRLTRLRAALVDRLREPFSRMYAEVAGQGQHAELTYHPSFEETLVCDQPEMELSRHFQRLYAGEVARGQNLIGPQRDDVTVSLQGMPAREFASNGEMWTLAWALKMALHELVSVERHTRPIIILDDVFAQLDDSRRHQIMEFAHAQEQVLITAAARGDVPESEDMHIIDVERLAERQRLVHDPEAMARRYLTGSTDEADS